MGRAILSSTRARKGDTDCKGVTPLVRIGAELCEYRLKYENENAAADYNFSHSQSKIPRYPVSVASATAPGPGCPLVLETALGGGWRRRRACRLRLGL